MTCNRLESSKKLVRLLHSEATTSGSCGIWGFFLCCCLHCRKCSLASYPNPSLSLPPLPSPSFPQSPHVSPVCLCMLSSWSMLCVTSVAIPSSLFFPTHFDSFILRFISFSRAGREGRCALKCFVHIPEPTSCLKSYKLTSHCQTSIVALSSKAYPKSLH